MKSIIPAAVGLLGAVAAAPWDRRQENNGAVNVTSAMINDFYAKFTPSPKLNWTQCFGGFTCTLLEVPLDYEDQKAGTTTIAFVKYSSGNPKAQDILVNPGGPGGSGVEFVALQPGLLRVLAGNSTDFNLVGFDPRGVGNSGIDLNCFNKNQTLADNFNSELTYRMSMSSAEAYQLAKAKGEYCSKSNKETNAKYGNTVAVAQDMHNYIRLQAEANRKPADEAKLFYWGISYGTALGQTYASLFPTNVGRMILDANVNGVQYFAGHSADAVGDMDKSFRTFFKYCHEAKPEVCSFRGKSSSSPKDLETRYFRVFQGLRESPIVVSDSSLSPTPFIITEAIVLAAIHRQLYSPISGYPLIANILTLLESGADVSVISGALLAAFPPPQEDPADSDVTEMIRCIDASPRFNLTVQQWKGVHEYYKYLSVFMGDQFARTNGLICAGYHIPPPKSQVFPGFKTTTTSAPILFVGTTADPITPLSNAHFMSKFFPGSAVLAQNAPGHSFTSTISACTITHVQNYMTKGELPKSGTICELDSSPFAPPNLQKRWLSVMHPYLPRRTASGWS